MSTKYKMSKLVRQNILSKLLPMRYLKTLLLMIFIMTVSPFLLLYFEPALFQDEKLLYYIVGTFSLSLIIDSILLGIILFHTKMPYMQEWKDRLGYVESVL